MVRVKLQEMKINQLDLFSGIGGFHLGFERAGYEVTSFFSEVDKHAIAVYKHQFPNSTYVGSVTDVRGGDLPNIDLITFGSPCQDFSLAGKRKGMEGDRSSLVLEAIRLIGECRPRVFVWENVKGTFSSNNGEDFAAILQAFTNIGGYRLEWQLLNTSWFLPQNRERIYLVGYSANPSGRGVFPIGESNEQTNLIGLNVVNSCEKDVQSRRVYGQDGICRTLTSGDYKSPVRVEVKQIGTKLDSNGGTQPYQQDRVYDADGIVPALNQGKSDLIIKESFRIRRLTPIECERLQGFPDNHTAFGIYDGEVKPMSKTHRYKQCGNAVTVDVVQAVAERLKPFPDDHTAYGNYDGEVKPMSNTQRYKQCGNAVTVDVVAAVAKNCLPLFK
jgi:DNA (cytosine-5)-methyltransferase 1